MNESPTQNPNPFEIQEPAPIAPPVRKSALPPPQKPTHKNLFIILGAAFFVLLAGAAAAYFLVIKKPAAPVSQQPANDLTEKVDTVKHDVPDMVNTETYKNPTLGLTLSHPSSWKVTEAADGGVRIESATFTYDTATGAPTDGNFRLYIRQGARTVDGTYIGRGYAIIPSEKLVYTKPTSGQRTDTLLSSFGYDTPDDFAFFMIAGNFPLVKGDTLGPNYAKEPDALVIVGGYSSPVNKDDLQMNEVPASYYNTSAAYKQAVGILKSIQVN